MLEFVRQRAHAAETVLSVCSGALILAKADLLHGLHATTHRGAVAELALDEPDCTVLPDARVVDNGKIVTTAGISMGIDAALYLVARHYGHEEARGTSAYMEYDWHHRTDRHEVAVDRARPGAWQAELQQQRRLEQQRSRRPCCAYCAGAGS